MDKEKILEKSREIHQDEGMEHAESQGREIGFIAFCILFIFLVIFNLFYGESVTFYAISSLFWALSAGESYGKYRFAKTKLHFISAIVCSITSILSVANYIIITLR
ncbi:MAG TPA: hypothetical protein DEF85_08450 [Clostridiaceae bacterium]|jgi:hypothetical protein|nr:hypothetical protein [Clostridiaceae bacterium]HBF78021.1 hypothetical protein [Clostridiaceae bacterium]HBN29264.1 hypothetical protein [Clostridiaceae bacterium]HBX48905.1 hypothetical protein [Clostridiaceae bacterium]HCL50266.1 hypothetical protein [Clostridiaceae bacterium]